MSLARTYKFEERKVQPSIHHYRAAEALAQQAGLNELLGLIRLEFGVAFMFLGNLDEAAVRLEDSRALYRELCAVEAARGNAAIATKRKEQSLSGKKFIAEHAGSSELRETFLSRPDVRAFLSP